MANPKAKRKTETITKLCGFCNHSENAHCKGNIEHLSSQTKWVSSSGIKGKFDKNGEPMFIHTCVSRHCMNPLCCCVDFKRGKR